MTYHVGLDPRAAALISRSPCEPHITCDGCSASVLVTGCAETIALTHVQVAR